MGQKGLTDAQAENLRLEFGKNVLPVKGGTPLVLIFLAQFKSPLIYILVIIAIISFLFQKYIDVALIISVVLLNSFMGFFQEYRAQKTLVALRNILKPKIIAIRNGQRKEIEISELVPGDIVVIGSGDKIPADGFLFWAGFGIINIDIYYL